MINLFVCQDCNTVVFSDNWEKYHGALNQSCPECNGEMCGCPSCVQSIEDENLIISYVDVENEFHKCTFPSGIKECMVLVPDLKCDYGCPYYEEVIC